jgi:hypothetical protein
MYRVYQRLREEISKNILGKFPDLKEFIDQSGIYQNGENLFLKELGVDDNSANNKFFLMFVRKNIENLKNKNIKDFKYELKNNILQYLQVNKTLNNLSNLDLSTLKKDYSPTGKDRSKFTLTGLHKEMDVVAKNDKYILYKTNDVESCMEISKGTNWCTKDPKFANSYLKNKDSYMYILTRTDGLKVALLHFESGQFRNLADKPVGQDIVNIVRNLWGDFDSKYYKYKMDSYSKEELNTFINNLPEVYGGDLNFEGDDITSLVNLKIVKGNLKLRKSTLEIFENLVEVEGNLDLIESDIEKLGSLTKVGKNLHAYDTYLNDLGNLTTVGISLDLSDSSIKRLNKLNTVGGNLFLNNTPLRDLGNLTTVGGKLFLTGTLIQDLGNLTSVGSYIVGFKGDKSKYPQFDFKD